MNHIERPPSRRLRRRLATLTVALAAMASAAFVAAGCSSANSGVGSYREPCEVLSCGGACSTDADCSAGMFCGTSTGSGACTAACQVGGKPCPEGFQCTDRGRCAQGGTIINPNPGGDAGSCKIDGFAGEGIPTDIFIMNDRSASMTCSIPTGGDRWQAMTSALTTFLSDPAATGLGVGIQYFGLGNNGESCDVNLYSQAEVGIAPLPSNRDALVNSLNNTTPDSYTPTPAAMAGARAYAQAWKASHPTHFVAIVLATDGQPNRCGDVGDVAAEAAAGFNANPSVPTYVIGIIGGAGSCNLDPAPPNQADLDQVAAAGGTNQAFIVDAATGDTAAQFLSAMNSIRGATQIPCEYLIPESTSDGQIIDANQVRVELIPNGQPASDVPRLSGSSACDASGGWYFDSQNARHVILCPATCDTVTNDRPQVNFILACVDQNPIR